MLNNYNCDLLKLSIEKPEQRYRNVPDVQMAINSSYQESIGMTPFKLTFGVEMRNPKYLPVCEAIQREFPQSVVDKLEDIRLVAKKQILKAQCEQQHTYNKNRKPEIEYKIG